jgi:pyruvate formate lyase activating enzyme
MTDESRRDFLRHCTYAALGAGALLTGLDLKRLEAAGRYPVGLKEASFYTRLANNEVQCHLCPCSCNPVKQPIPGRLKDGQTCACNVRTNRGGKLYVTNYGRAGVLREDPLEKNPLYHFRPAMRALTVAAPGCSMVCKGCQNWQLALSATENVNTVDAPPAKVVKLAQQQGCQAISYTYTEPMMFIEYMTDIARLAREQGMYNTVVTGGYVFSEAVKDLCKVVDAFSISVKAYNDQDFYDYAKGKLSVIQQTMATVRTSNRWLEVVVLVIPTISDDLKGMGRFLRWVKAELGADTPVHLDRFWPSYKLTNLPQTPQKVLEEARALAVAEGLKYAYVGNLPGHRFANTYCPKCGKALLRRVAFTVAENNLANGACPACKTTIPGIWGA